ncbi:MAG TPA: NEW3 domain-containing protein [Xanthobacteraceae bacterium]|nr:NEW3 domain-containing protein [Xanthobacteraceae bacterium]
MRSGFIVAVAAAFAVLIAPLTTTFGLSAMAEDAPKDVRGIFLMSDYPAVTLRPGETSTISLRLQNYDMTPERLGLSVTGVPAGWTATLLGGGQPVAAAMPAANSSVSLSLRLDVPKNAAMGMQTITVAAQGNATNLQLPINVTLAKDLPAKLTLTPQLPDLRGTSKSSFEYQLGIKNDSGKKLTVSLSAQGPQNFDTSFTEQYGTQELKAVPVDAGQSKDVKLKVTPPNTAAAGDYKIIARVAAEDASATADLAMTITGQPKLEISGREGLVSTRASAGKESSVPVIITNTGTAPADDIQLTGSTPSGWKITFDPKTVDRIAPNDNKEVQALITPTEKAIAGDYVTTVRASARGESASTNFRVTVTTSTMWGIAGVGIIGVALLVMVGAVARFGRR